LAGQKARAARPFARAGLAVAVAAASLASPSAGAPRSAAERTAAEFLRVFNNGDRSAYDSFLRSRWPAFKGGDEFAQMRDQTGGYVLVRTGRVANDEVREVVKSRLADDYWSFDVRLADQLDGKIQSLEFTPVERPADVPPPGRVPPAAIARLADREISALGDFSGVVAVAVNGRPIYARAAGLADRERGIPNTVETRFGMASMGKMFTAVAILQLVQAGKVDLDAAIGTYIKDYPNAEFARTVTVRELLTHTGGAGDFFSKLWADNLDHLKTPADYVALFGSRAPEFKPGSRFSYANYGFIVLGRVVEKVSRQPFDEYLQSNVFAPAHMTRTSLHAVGPRLVTALTYVKDGYPAPPAAFLSRPTLDATPAGGAFATAPDMLAFAVALTGHRLLDSAHTQMLFTPQVQGDSGPDGLGFQIFSQDGVGEVGHEGGGPGENGGFRILAGGKATVIVLSNVAPSWRGDKLCAYISARLSVD
jgi:CubicO group peptidase (beta-lactamase class C family)